MTPDSNIYQLSNVFITLLTLTGSIFNHLKQYIYYFSIILKEKKKESSVALF